MNIRPRLSQGRDYCGEKYGGAAPQGMCPFFSFLLNPELISELVCPPVQTQHLTLPYCHAPSKKICLNCTWWVYIHPRPAPNCSANHLCPGCTVFWCNHSDFSTPSPEGKHKLLWELLISSFFYFYGGVCVEEADRKTPDGHWNDWKSNPSGLWMPGTASATKAT